MTAITVDQLTEASVDGAGIFDVLMRANKAHLDEEYAKNRIKGTEYATVYLGSVTAILQYSMQFLLNQQKTDLEAQLLEAQIKKTEADIALVTQQTANAVTEGDNLVKQGCLLAAQYDVAMETKLQTIEQTALLAQKKVTEKAQTVESGVDDNSVIGKQKLLYAAQTAGFARDAEQKAAKIMVDSWNVRRTTDEATVADSTNLLNDATIGRAVTTLLAGVGA